AGRQTDPEVRVQGTGDAIALPACLRVNKEREERNAPSCWTFGDWPVARSCDRSGRRAAEWVSARGASRRRQQSPGDRPTGRGQPGPVQHEYLEIRARVQSAAG